MGIVLGQIAQKAWGRNTDSRAHVADLKHAGEWSVNTWHQMCVLNQELESIIEGEQLDHTYDEADRHDVSSWCDDDNYVMIIIVILGILFESVATSWLSNTLLY